MPERNIGIAEYAVMKALDELQSDVNKISSTDIADLISCDRKTVQRAIRSLIAAGKVRRGDGSSRQGGFQYHVQQ